MDERFSKETDFVARRYSRHAFSEKRAWERMELGKRSVWKLPLAKIAAAVAALVVVGATAALLLQRKPEPQLPQTTQVEQTSAVAPSRDAVRALDFDDAPLTEVIAEIESTYGVTVGNVPSDAETQRISLHFEGDADELIEMINDILDIQLTIN